MTSNVIDILTFRRGTAPEDVACDKVRSDCAHRVSNTILAQAMARAVRLVAQGMRSSEAAARATKLALDVIHPEPPEAA